MILLAAMAAMAALMLAATPALAQSEDDPPAGKITICHATGSATNPFVEITISENGLEGHGDHEGDIIPAPAGGCPGPDDGDGNGDGNGDDNGDRDRDRRDNRDNRDNVVVPVFEITQDLDQDAESGDVDQSFDVSQTGDNSNQTAGIQGVANTGNAQTQLGVIDAGGFGDFDGNNDNDRFFVRDNNDDDFCDNDDRSFFDFCDNDNDDLCDVFGGDFCDDDNDHRFVFDDDDNVRVFGDNDGDDFELEDVGSTIEVSPTNTTSSDQQVNQAATAFGK